MHNPTVADFITAILKRPDAVLTVKRAPGGFSVEVALGDELYALQGWSLVLILGKLAQAMQRMEAG